MDERYRDLLGSCRGEYVTADLEKCKRDGCSDDIAAGVSDAIPQRRYSALQTGE